MTAGTPGQAACCGCPETDGKIYHQRGTCTDPVVEQLDWYADVGRIAAAPGRPGRAPGQAVREAFGTWYADPSWKTGEPWGELPSWLREKWESIAQAGIAAYIEANGGDPVDARAVILEAAAAREPDAAPDPADAMFGPLPGRWSDPQPAPELAADNSINSPGPRSEGVPAPELAAAMAEPRELRKIISELLGMFRAVSGGWGARTSSSRLRKIAGRAGVPWNEFPPSRTVLGGTGDTTYRDEIVKLVYELEASSQQTSPSKKSDIERAVIARLQAILEAE